MQKIVLAAAVLTGLAHAQEIWVDPQAGSNANVGTYDMPLQTLDAAVAAAGPGARVMLLPGTYGPSFNGEVLPIGLGAANQQGIEIRGIGEPGDVEFDLAGSNSTVFRLLAGADGARITNITIRNTDQTGWWTRAIRSHGTRSPTRSRAAATTSRSSIATSRRSWRGIFRTHFITVQWTTWTRWIRPR